MSRKLSSRGRRSRRRAALAAQESAFVRRVLAGDSVEAGTNDLPLVDRALDCALPLFGHCAAYPECPQAQGTCIAVDYDGASFLLATKHEIDGAPEDGVAAPLGFKRGMSFRDWAGVARPQGVAWLPCEDPDDPDRFDLVVLPFQRKPSWSEDVKPIVLDKIARSTAFSAGAPFAIAGYPRSDKMTNMDYDAQRLRRDRFSTLGRYVGPTGWAAGCHTLEADTIDVGGPDGLSGGPVLRFTYDENHIVEWGFAGVIVRGGPTLVHFIDAVHVLRLLGAARSRFGWPIDLRRGQRSSSVAT